MTQTSTVPFLLASAAMPGARRGGLLVGVALIAASFVGAGGAQADRLSDRRAEADRVQADVAELDHRLAAAIEAFNAAELQLQETERAIQENSGQIEVTRRNLEVAEDDLSLQLVADYRYGQVDAVGVILGAGSLVDMLDRIDLVRRTSSRTTTLIGEVLTFSKQLERRGKTLGRQRKARERALTQRTERRAAIRAGMKARQQRLRTIAADIKQIIAEREAAERAAAARRAAAAVAAQQAAAEEPAAPDPGIGGSTGGSTGGSSPAPPEPAPVAPPPPSAGGSSVVAAALSQVGVPYKWGGASPSEGFDCSGLSMWAYAHIGVSLPHFAAAQHAMGTPVDRSNLAPGDLVFFNGDNHMGIYMGGGQFVHAPRTGDVVKVSNLDGYPGYNGAVRI